MKICPVCGAQIQDTDMVCPVCGAQLAAQEAVQQFQQGVVDPAMQYQQDMSGMANQYGVDPYTQPQGMMPEPPKSGNGKKIAIIAGIIAAVAAIACVLIFVVFKKDGKGSSSAKAVAQRCVDALFDGDSDEVLKCFPEGMMSSEEEKLLKESLQYFTMFSSMIKSVKAGSEEKITGAEADQYISQFKNQYNVSVDEIASVPVTYEMEFMGETSSQTMDIICGKIDGKWYVLSGVN